jgi:hypothetical protein
MKIEKVGVIKEIKLKKCYFYPLFFEGSYQISIERFYFTDFMDTADSQMK